MEYTEPHKATALITESSFVPLLVLFSAPWCAPCRAVRTAITQLASDRGETLRTAIVNIDDDAAQSLMIDHHVTSVPTMLVVHDGKVVVTWKDPPTLRHQLEQRLESTLALA